MTLHQLRQFAQIAECENISLAARKMYISQPTLTRLIQRLEEELGAELFERKGKNMTLNDNGKMVLKSCKNIFMEIEEMKHSVKCNKIYDRLCVATNLKVISQFLIPLFRESHKDVLVDVQYKKQQSYDAEVLESDQFDLVISEKAIEGREIQNILLTEERFLLDVPLGHPLAEYRSVFSHELSGLSIVDSKTARESYNIHFLYQYLKKKKVDLKFITLEDSSAVDCFLKWTDYCCFNGRFVSQFNTVYQMTGRKEILIKDPDLKIPYYLSYKREKEKQVAQFQEWLIQNIRC